MKCTAAVYSRRVWNETETVWNTKGNDRNVRVNVLCTYCVWLIIASRTGAEIDNDNNNISIVDRVVTVTVDKRVTVTRARMQIVNRFELNRKNLTALKSLMF